MNSTADLDPTNAPVPTNAMAAPSGPIPAEAGGGLVYVQTLRPITSGRWWRSLVGIVAIVLGYLILTLLLPTVAVVIEIATGSRSGSGAMFQMSPLMMLAVNLSAAALIPMAMLLDRLLYGRTATLHSVQGRLRVRWMLRLAVIVVPIFAIYAVAGSWLSPSTQGTTDHLLWWLVIVLLTTPLQAAGEEYGFRGFLGRVVGSWFGAARVAVAASTVLTAIVFMIAHGSLDPWLLSYYFVFGVVMSLVTWRTGGLEAAVVLHVVNNMIMMVIGMFTSDMATGFDRSVGVGGPFMLVQMALIAAFGVGISLLAHRQRISRRTGPAPEGTATTPATQQ